MRTFFCILFSFLLIHSACFAAHTPSAYTMYNVQTEKEKIQQGQIEKDQARQLEGLEKVWNWKIQTTSQTIGQQKEAQVQAIANMSEAQKKQYERETQLDKELKTLAAQVLAKNAELIEKGEAEQTRRTQESLKAESDLILGITKTLVDSAVQVKDAFWERQVWEQGLFNTAAAQCAALQGTKIEAANATAITREDAIKGLALAENAVAYLKKKNRSKDRR